MSESTFGERLKLLRTSNGMTIKELAEKLDLSTRSISFFEVNEREPNIKTILKISNIFGCSLDYLLGKNTEVESSAKVPFYDQIVNGEISGEPNDYFPLPEHFVRGRDIFLFPISDDSLIEDGIFKGDYVLIDKKSKVPSKSIGAILIENALIFRRITRQNDFLVMSPSNSSMHPILADERDVKLVGKVIGVFRDILPNQSS